MAATKNTPLLSIVIPTFERAELLDRLLTNIVSEVELIDDRNELEILISDNDSSDNTKDVVMKFQEQMGDRLIKYYRQDKNIGLLANFISTIENSTGDFWMPYGDDDLIPKDGLKKILTAMKEHSEAVLHVYSGVGDDRLVSITEITDGQYYNLGNCGVSAVKVTSLRTNFEKYKNLLLCSCWPITQAAYVALSLEQVPLAFHASFISSLSLNHRENTSYSTWYVVYTPVYALLYVAKRLRPHCGEDFYQAALKHVLQKGRVNGYLSSAWFYSTYIDTPGKIRSFRKATIKAFRRSDMGTRFKLSRFALIAYLPAWLKMMIDGPRLIFQRRALNSLACKIAFELDQQKRMKNVTNYSPSTFLGKD